MKWFDRKSLLFKVTIIILFVLSLTSFRLLWINHFQHEKDQPLAIAGEIDLQQWDFSNSGITTISGEWAFYPYLLIDDMAMADHSDERKLIQVPGDWSYELNGDENNPYGYGTYHLRIKVNPETEEVFKIQVPSARSSSTLFIKDRKSTRLN